MRANVEYRTAARTLALVGLAACSAPVRPVPAPNPTPTADVAVPIAPIAPPPVAAPVAASTPPPGSACEALPELAAVKRPVFQPQTRHAMRISDLAFSRDGRYLGSASEDGSVRVWELATRRLVRAMRARTVTQFTAIGWSCSGDVIATAYRPVMANGYYEAAVIALDVTTGEVRDVTLDKQGVAAVWGGSDAKACWTHATGKGLAVRNQAHELVATHPVPKLEATHAFAATPDGRIAVLLDGAQTATVIADNKPAHTWPIRHERRAQVALARDGKQFAVIAEKAIQLLDTRSGKLLASVPGLQSWSGFDAVALVDQTLFAVDHTGLRAYSLARKQWLWHVAFAGGRAELEASTDGKTIAYGAGDGRIALYRASDGAALGELGAAMAVPHRVAFSARGDEAFVLAGDRIARWSLVTGELMQTLVAPGLHELAVQPDGALVIARRGTAKCDAAEPVRLARFAALPDRLDPPGAQAPTKALQLVVEPDAAAASRELELCVALPPPGKAFFGDPDLWRDGAIAQDFVVQQQDTGFGVRRGDKSIKLDGANRVGWDGVTVARRARRVLALRQPYLGGNAGAVLWDADTGKWVAWFTIKDGRAIGGATGGFGSSSTPPRRGAVSDDGKRVAIAAATTLAVFDVATPESGRVLALPVEAATIAFAGARVVVGGVDGSLTVIEGDRVETSASRTGRGIIQLGTQGERALAVDEEGLVQLWDLRTRVPIIALSQFDDGEGLAISPQGFYVGSYDAVDRTAWVFAKPAAAIPASQYDRVARNPGWIADRLACRAKPALVDLAAPPRVALVTRPPAKTPGDRLALQLDVAGAVEVVAFVEGREGARVKSTATRVQLDVALVPGQNAVELIAFDAAGVASPPLALRVERTAPRTPRGTLWVIAVGVSDYPKLPDGMQLRYADDDAKALAAVLRRSAPQFYTRAEVSVLADADVTIAAVDAALAQLAQMAPDDVAVVLFSGHGVRLPSGKMVFATPATAASIASFEASGIGWDAVAKRLAAAKGKVLVMLDACHAGAMVGELLAPNSRLATSLVQAGRGGTIVFSASRAAQVSREGKGNGRFTAAFLEATGDARTDTNADGMLALSEIVDGVARRVMAVSSNTQEPNVVWREVLGDFALLPAPVP